MEIGIIGMGAMGKMYAKKLADSGYKINGGDIPERVDDLKREFEGQNVDILKDGIAVSRRSDLIFYSVPAGEIENTVRQYGPSTKLGAIVGGHTSVKTPEIEAFEKYLPRDNHIVTSHSLHAPSVDPLGQTMVAVNHRSSESAYQTALDIFGKLGSKIVEMNYADHDKATADTQAVTHLGFLSMGTAWRKMGGRPWENGTYVGGIDNTKLLMMLRIHGGTPHVYSGLAILNPHARMQVKQYSDSVSDLFGMMISGRENEFRTRIQEAASNFVQTESPILLDDELLGEYSLAGSGSERKPNSHLSLLTMVDAWHKLGINPYDNLVCKTPPFKLRLGIAEYLFRTPDLLEESLDAAINNMDLRTDDHQFSKAVLEWASVIEHKDIKAYHKKFERNRKHFEDKIDEGKELSGKLIEKLP